MAIDGPGRDQLRALAARLKEAGEEGKGFRKELMKQLDDAARPLLAEIGDPAHLKPYMPDRYAEVLAADLTVTVERHILTANPAVTIRASARKHKRKLGILEEGRINHPVFARGERRKWEWVNGQRGGMLPGFFRDPCRKATPDIRKHVLAAIDETARKITAP